jgi:DUF4097 and DUF4098 domain-containing protein YvlB
MRLCLRRFLTLSILAIAAVLAAFPVFASTEGHFDRTLHVTGPVDLDVQTSSGSIVVHAGSSEKIEVHGMIHANGWTHGDVDARIHKIETNPPVEQNGNTIRIGRVADRELLRNISISYELVVPGQTKLHSESGSGDQTVDGIDGPAEVTSGSGGLRFSNIGGEVYARTGSGDIELNLTRGNTRASTGSGSIRALGIAGGLNASSGSGSIKLEQTAAGDVAISTGSGSVEIRGVKGAVHVTTGSGSIVAQGEATGEWRLRTGSGDVTVELPAEAAFDVAARTSSGHIETNHELTVKGTISPRELDGKVRGGGALVDVSTSSGSIRIR